MVLWFPGCSHSVVTCRAGQSGVDAPDIQCRVVEARRKAPAGLMAILAYIRRRRVSWAFADRFGSIACDMTVYALLGFDGWISMVDRIGFLEVTGRRVTSIAFPPVSIHRGMHGVIWMALSEIDRIVVRDVVASAATRCVGRMYRIHKWVCFGKATYSRTIDARTVVCIRVTGAAIIRRGDVTCRF